MGTIVLAHNEYNGQELMFQTSNKGEAVDRFTISREYLFILGHCLCQPPPSLSIQQHQYAKGSLIKTVYNIFLWKKYETFACSSHELYRVFISIILLCCSQINLMKKDGRKHSLLYPVIAGTNLHLCCCFRPIVVLSSPCGMNCTRRGLLTTLKQCGYP